MFIAGLAALLLALRLDQRDRRARLFWAAVGAACLALAVNKQVDAQEFLVEGSAAALLDPIVLWMRDTAVLVVVLVLAVVGVLATMAVAWMTSGLTRFRLAVAGVVLLGVVALLRTAEIVRLGPVSVRLDHDRALPFELAGAFVVLVATARQWWLCRSQRSIAEPAGHSG